MIPLIDIGLSMELVYMACAAGGGALIVLQTVLALAGVADADVAGSDFDVHGDAHDGQHGDGSFHLFSLRAVFSFFTFFGLAGWAATSAGWNPALTVLVAFSAGLAVMLGVAWLLRAQSKLESAGTLRPENALGKTARVYLRVPASNTGRGKITVVVQNRSHEFNAFTNGPEIPTGATVKVVKLSTPDTFEVEPVPGERS
jgi:hypothetical protein